MRHLGYLSARERAACSQLVNSLRQRPLVRGGLVTMARSCGNQGCKRTMVYVPRSVEEEVRSWVETYRELEGRIDVLSQGCMERLFKNKKEARGED